MIEIGGHIARWVSLDQESSGQPHLVDFSLNDQCAAGVGAFLVQQAGRLKMGIEEFSQSAEGAKTGASIAGRCAVFAKSDMIHLQQKGTDVSEIAYGLCLALARNFQATVLKGRKIPQPIALAGGGALNGGLVRAFREVLGASNMDLWVLPDPVMLGAMGAARVAAREAAPQPIGELATRLASRIPARRSLALEAAAPVREPRIDRAAHQSFATRPSMPISGWTWAR